MIDLHVIPECYIDTKLCKLELSYFQEFDVVAEVPENIQLLKHRTELHHYLIFIRPTMEKWIVACADKSNIKLPNFNLPHHFLDLAKITKTSKSENDDPHSGNFKNLFKEFKRVNPPPVAVLIFWIQYLKNNPYSADLQHLVDRTNEIIG